jgi:hypothetical protein
VLPRAAVGVSCAPAEAFFGLPAAPHSIRSDRAEACLNRGDMGAPDDFAVNGQTVRLRLGDRGPTLQLNANGIGKSAQTWLRINHTDASGLARGDRLDDELVFSGADWRAPTSAPVPDPLPNPSRTFRLELEIASTRHSAALPPRLPRGQPLRCTAPGRHYLRFTARHRDLLSCAGALSHRTAPASPHA